MCIGIPDKVTERRAVFCFVEVEVEVEPEGCSRGSWLSILFSLTAGMTGKKVTDLQTRILVLT